MQRSALICDTTIDVIREHLVRTLNRSSAARDFWWHQVVALAGISGGARGSAFTRFQ
jgi:hypothetical protein